jgi:hypothetical protein
MNKVLGYSFMGVGLLGFFFFLKYKGTAIPLKELWFVLSICILFAGSYFLAKYKLQKLNNQRKNIHGNRRAEIERLKRIGDKVRVTLDNAEVKTRSYRQEIINEELPSRIEMLDALYDSSRNYKTQEIQQTYIVFYKQYSGKDYKFISQATIIQNADTVKMYMDKQKGVDLYIDPKNPTNYYFDLPHLLGF